MPGAHLFLSYSRLEVDFAKRLARDLRNAGVRLWMDQDAGQPEGEEALRGGENWRRTIETAIDEAAGLVAVVSPAFIASNYCPKELARISERRKRVYPVLLRRVAAPPLDLQLAQWIDFTRWKDENCYRSALRKLVHAIEAAQGLETELDPESAYLLDRIAEQEAILGVRAFVELAGEALDTAEQSAVRPPPPSMQAWEQETEFESLDDASGDADASEDRRPVPLESITAALERFSQFVLLGEPGAGKSTTLCRLEMNAARERLVRPSAPLPLFLRLPAWSNEATFEDFLRAHWPFDSDPLDALGGLLLLLDGLNEMGAYGSGKAAELTGFLQRYRHCRVVVSCRSGDYGSALNLGLARVTMQAMDEARVRRFAEAYLADAAEDFLAQIGCGDLQRRPEGGFTDGTGGLAHLVRNPYLLRALIFIFRESDTGALPSNTGALFRRLVDLLWKRERRHRTAGWVPYAVMLAQLSALAVEVLRRGLSTELPADMVAAHADRSLVAAACHASLLEQTEQGTRFYHQLMQEYFAAEALSTDTLLAHVEAPRFDGAVGFLHGPWDEVIVAKSGLLPDGDDFVNRVAQINLYLAAEAVGSGARVSEAVRAGLIERLFITAFGGRGAPWEWPDDSAQVQAAIRGFAALGAVDALQPIIEALQINNTGIIAAACDAIARLGDASAAPALIAELGGWDSDDQALRQSGMRRRISAGIAADAERALTRLGKVVVPACLDVLSRRENYNDNTLAALLYILGRIGDAGAIEPILAFSETLAPFSVAMASADPLRAYTYQALGRLRARRAIPLLAGALEDDAPDPQDLPHAELRDGRPDLSGRLSLQAARALALIGGEDAHQVLRAHGLPETPVPIDAYD